MMNKEEYIGLRKSVRSEIMNHIKQQDEHREKREKSLRLMIDGIRGDIRMLHNLVVGRLLTTSARENELIAEIDKLKEPA
jgi:hypothetical protein